MKHFFILILIFTSYLVRSQSYECIKKLDTIYITFTGGAFEIKMDFPEEKNGFKNRRYIFNYKKNKENSFSFEIEKNPERTIEIKKVFRSFLRKNKRKIVKIEALQKFDYQDIQCELFNQLKTFYIIDFSEKKNKTVLLYKVINLNPCYSVE